MPRSSTFVIWAIVVTLTAVHLLLFISVKVDDTLKGNEYYQDGMTQQRIPDFPGGNEAHQDALTQERTSHFRKGSEDGEVSEDGVTQHDNSEDGADSKAGDDSDDRVSQREDSEDDEDSKAGHDSNDAEDGDDGVTQQRIPDASSAVMAGSTSIPHIIYFSHVSNILETKQPLLTYENFLNTITKFRSSWDEPDAEVQWLNKATCREKIKSAKPNLLPYFDEENVESHKDHMCRVAVLYLSGGYYIDVELPVDQPHQPREGATFIATNGCGEAGACFFLSFIASAPKHPVLRKTLDGMLQRYYHNYGDKSLLGPVATFKAYYELSTDNTEQDYRMSLLEHDEVFGDAFNVSCEALLEEIGLQHPGEECWQHCNEQAGPCEWCGSEGYCCRFGQDDCDIAFVGGNAHRYTCVIRGDEFPYDDVTGAAFINEGCLEGSRSAHFEKFLHYLYEGASANILPSPDERIELPFPDWYDGTSQNMCSCPPRDQFIPEEMISSSLNDVNQLRSGKRKIAFVLMEYDSVTFPDIWKQYFSEANPSHFVLYVHVQHQNITRAMDLEDYVRLFPDDDRLNGLALPNFGNLRILPTSTTSSYCYIMPLLLSFWKEAITDENVVGVINLSGSCLPVKTFSDLHRELLSNQDAPGGLRSVLNYNPDRMKAATWGFFTRDLINKMLEHEEVLEEPGSCTGVGGGWGAAEEKCPSLFIRMFGFPAQHGVVTFDCWSTDKLLQHSSKHNLVEFQKETPCEFSSTDHGLLDNLIDSGAFFARKFLKSTLIADRDVTVERYVLDHVLT